MKEAGSAADSALHLAQTLVASTAAATDVEMATSSVMESAPGSASSKEAMKAGKSEAEWGAASASVLGGPRDHSLGSATARGSAETTGRV